MPKVVDPVQRRRELAEAVWRVIRRDGLESASVREVAREAGLSTGSLRHYFASQSALLTFAMRTVMERIQNRIDALKRAEDPLEDARLVLAELLPLDAERQAENEVWLAFTARALVDADLRELRGQAHDLLRAGCGRIVTELLAPGSPHVGVETERLFALLDGLAVHAAVHPRPAEDIRAVIDYHLADLMGSAS